MLSVVLKLVCGAVSVSACSNDTFTVEIKNNPNLRSAQAFSGAFNHTTQTFALSLLSCYGDGCIHASSVAVII